MQRASIVGKANFFLGMFIMMNSCAVHAQEDTIRWFAHRGFIGIHPESTIEGMKRALHYKHVVLEMDLAITKDKQVVVSHDPLLNQKITSGLSETKPAAEEKIAIYQTTYADLSAYDVGMKPNPGFPEQIRYKAQIPRFADLIDSVEQYAARKGLRPPSYFIETKLKPETDGKYHPGPEEFVDLMLAVIFEKGIQDRIIIQSFDPRTLQIIHQQHPEIPLAFLSKAGTTLEANLAWIGFAPTYYSAKPALITDEFMSKCRALGISPIVGVFKGYNEFLHLKALGVKGFIADYPIEYLEAKKE